MAGVSSVALVLHPFEVNNRGTSNGGKGRETLELPLGEFMQRHAVSLRRSELEVGDDGPGQRGPESPRARRPDRAFVRDATRGRGGARTKVPPVGRPNEGRSLTGCRVGSRAGG